MKYLLFITILLFSLTTTYSQIYKFRAFETKAAFYNEKGKDISSNEWQKTNILIVVDSDKEKISIYAKKEVYIDILTVSVTHDADGDYVTYKGVDDGGVKMNAVYYMFKDKSTMHIGNLVLDYGSYVLAYRLKNTD